ncbi:ABA4-like family protein [Dactylosporangium sp. NPDC000521]|uniref:ABA4-like family protein n=1 Tax=Dactylosporangium sp. NPDC000521 TaxID=3363975 RepID=UPI0036BD9EDE
MADTLFQLAFLVVVPFWALMIVAPGWRWSERIAGSVHIALPALVVWAFAIAPVLREFATEMLNPDLAGVRALFADDDVVAAVWAQVLAWDLLVGRWIYLDSRERRVHPLIMAPLLMLTILLSPIGLPLYLALRTPLTRRPVTPGARPRQSDQDALTRST